MICRPALYRSMADGLCCIDKSGPLDGLESDSARRIFIGAKEQNPREMAGGETRACPVFVLERIFRLPARQDEINMPLLLVRSSPRNCIVSPRCRAFPFLSQSR